MAKVCVDVLKPRINIELLQIYSFSIKWSYRGSTTIPENGDRFCQKRNAAKHGKVG
jgi:hypothetical protein